MSHILSGLTIKELNFVLIFIFLFGFLFGSWVFFPAERLTIQDECVCDCPSPEVFLVEDFSVVDGYYYADVDDLRRVQCEFKERLTFAD